MEAVQAEPNVFVVRSEGPFYRVQHIFFEMIELTYKPEIMNIALFTTIVCLHEKINAD